MPPPEQPTPRPASSAETAYQDWMNISSQRGNSSVLNEEPSPEVRLPDYEILGPLGSGGMGVVVKARQTRLNRVVALKMLHAGTADPDDVARFKIEAEAVARLQHPNIVQIHEIGDLGNGMPFIALEFVPGGSLKDRLKGEPQPPRDAAALVETLARAMAHAHAHMVVHRDLKPANILLALGDQPSVGRQTASAMKLNSESSSLFAVPKITDFGLAKRLDDPTGQTKTGDIVGTPSYMAPEQAGLTGQGAVSKAPVGPLADVYALGAILYELLTGRPPFRGVGAMETIWQVLTEDVMPPTQLQRKVPKDLETVCLKCLHKEPGKRYPSALALAEDLQRFQRNEPVHARPASAWELAVKWCKRNPSKALIVVLAILAAARMGHQYWWNHSTLATAQAEANQLRPLAWDNAYRLADQGDAARAAEQAERLLAMHPEDAEQLFQAARVHARCVATAAATAKKTEYADRAMQLLEQARNAGAFSGNDRRRQLYTDSTWDALRELTDFRMLFPRTGPGLN
jgi:serine/threonine protein kinase